MVDVQETLTTTRKPREYRVSEMYAMLILLDNRHHSLVSAISTFFAPQQHLDFCFRISSEDPPWRINPKRIVQLVLDMSEYDSRNAGRHLHQLDAVVADVSLNLDGSHCIAFCRIPGTRIGFKDSDVERVRETRAVQEVYPEPHLSNDVHIEMNR
jgi:hypothetical protein